MQGALVNRQSGHAADNLDEEKGQTGVLRSVIVPTVLIVLVFLLSPLLFDGMMAIGLAAP